MSEEDGEQQEGWRGRWLRRLDNAGCCAIELFVIAIVVVGVPFMLLGQ